MPELDLTAVIGGHQDSRVAHDVVQATEGIPVWRVDVNQLQAVFLQRIQQLQKTADCQIGIRVRSIKKIRFQLSTATST